jgi:hypothetical protein
MTPPGLVIDLRACRDHLLSAGLLPPGTLGVFCGGSVARGWASPLSDYDIYVIAAERFAATASVLLSVPLRPDTVPAHVTSVDGRPWEIKYWTQGQVGQMLGKVSMDCFESGEMTRSLIDVESLFIERLVTGLPVIGEDWLAACRDDIRKSAYREFLVAWSLADADKATENAVGQLAGGDPHSALLSAHAAMRHTVDALLDSLECYGTLAQKWRARRMLDAAPSVLPFDQYWAMETMHGLDRENPEPWIRRIISWCKQTAMEIEV